MRWKLILKKNIRHKPIKRQRTLILKISTNLKIGTNTIQNNGENLRSYTTRVLWWNWHFPVIFLKHCKNNVNESHNITIDVKNNIKIMATEQGLYAQAVMLCLKDLKITKAKQMKLNSSSKVSIQDQNVGLILILIGLTKILSHMNLVSIGK